MLDLFWTHSGNEWLFAIYSSSFSYGTNEMYCNEDKELTKLFFDEIVFFIETKWTLELQEWSSEVRTWTSVMQELTYDIPKWTSVIQNWTSVLQKWTLEIQSWTSEV